MFCVPDTGELYVWGSNAEGQLGLDSEEVFTPTVLTLPEHVVGIACGYYHTVAITGNMSFNVKLSHFFFFLIQVILFLFT